MGLVASRLSLSGSRQASLKSIHLDPDPDLTFFLSFSRRQQRNLPEKTYRTSNLLTKRLLMSAFINWMACFIIRGFVANLDPDSRRLRAGSGSWFGNVISIRIRNICLADKKLSVSDPYVFIWYGSGSWVLIKNWKILLLEKILYFFYKKLQFTYL